MFGLNTGLLGVASVVSAGFAPPFLFAFGEQGAWYDPSDLSTMFQDAAGTTPVTADGQPVGLILDKSKGLALGPELAVNGDFNSGTGWTLGAGWTVSGGKLNASTTQYTRAWYNVAAGAFVTGKTYKIEFDVSGYVAGTFLAFLSASGGAKEGQCYFISTGNGHKICYIRATSTVSGFGFEDESGSPPNFSIDNVSVKELPGNHATQATAAARPLYKTDGTYHWLQFDGVDDSLSTSAINFTVIDKILIFSGFLKSSAAAWKYIFGTTLNSDTTPGSFGLYAPGGADTNIDLYAKGTLATANKNITSAGQGVKLTMTGKIDLSSSVSINTNGGSFSQASSNMGGSFANDVLVIGKRGDGSYLFPGNLYSLIIRGALSTADEITATETWVNSKTGAY